MKIGLKIINIYILYIFMTQISKKKMRKNYKSNKNKSKKRGTFLKGGSRHTNAQLTLNNPPSPRWRPNWSTVVNVVGLQLYGTSLPFWNQADMENILRFYLFRKDINKVISLQACGTPEQLAQAPAHCDPPADLENTTFYAEKARSNSTNVDPNVEFINIFIRDMTPGTIVAWGRLSSYRFDTLENKTIIHCLAGFGRTGSALLFYIMYYKLNVFDILLNSFFNKNNSAGMYNFIRTLMQQNIVLDNNPAENNPWNGPGPRTIAAFNPANVMTETTSLVDRLGQPDIYHANLLISRINYCILFFAYQQCVSVGTPMYLYQKLANNVVPSPNNIFQPIRGTYVPAQVFDQNFLNAVFVAP
jgi:hypothetical protein